MLKPIVKLRLGDKVHNTLSPIVKVLDKTLKTNLKNCMGCRNRRDWLNGVDNEKPS